MKTNKIRVLHFTKVINRNDFIDVIVRYANPEQFEMYAAAWQDESNIEYHRYPDEGIPFYNLDIKAGLFGFLKGAWRLHKLLRKHRIDILHTHHYYESVVGWLACLLYKKTKLVFGRHYHNEFYLTASGLKLKFYLWVEGLVNRFSSAIVVPSKVIKELIEEQGINGKKIKVVHYAFDFSQSKYKVLSPEVRQEKRTALGWNDSYVVGNFARHHPIKGQQYLLEAFEKFSTQVPDAKLVMIGDGTLRESLEQWVAARKLQEKVVFLGWRKDGSLLMNLCDVIVHPTLQEAFPQTMIEVMVLKVPLVITPVSGAVDVIKDEENGYLVPVQSSEAILEKLIAVHDNSQKSREVGEEACAFVKRNLSIEKIIPQYENVYKGLMK